MWSLQPSKTNTKSGRRDKKPSSESLSTAIHRKMEETMSAEDRVPLRELGAWRGTVTSGIRETVSRANAMMRSAAGSGSMATLRKGGHLRIAAPRLSAAPRVSAAWSPLPRRSLAQLAATITTITTTMPRVKSNESNAFT
jgi:hypothetical protein